MTAAHASTPPAAAPPALVPATPPTDAPSPMDLVLAATAAAPPAITACAHCLRPAFTALLAQALERGAALNLVAAPGQGAGRLLEDLKALGGGRGPWLVANLKHHRYDIAALVATLWRQTGQELTPDTGPAPADFADLGARLARDAPGAVLLLHRFDALLDNPDLDPAYDGAFVDQLNTLHNAGVALVCVTDAPLGQRVLLTRDRALPGSVLDLGSPWTLPALLLAEVDTELARRLPGLDLVAPERVRIAAAVIGHPRPLDLLEEACHRLADGSDGDLPLPRRIARWRRALAQRGWPGSRGLLRLRDGVRVAWRTSGLDRLPWRAVSDWLKGVLRFGRGGGG